MIQRSTCCGHHPAHGGGISGLGRRECMVKANIDGIDGEGHLNNKVLEEHDRPRWVRRYNE